MAPENKLSQSKSNCTICNTKLADKYCQVCGQYNTGKKISFYELIADFMAGMFSLERSVLATMWLLIRRPEIVIQNYWAGWRGYYPSPGKIAVYAAFVVGLHFAFLGKEFLGLNMTFTNVPPQFGLIILLIPLYSLSSKITFFRQKHRYIEHLISTVYLYSTWIIVFTFLDIIQKYVLGNFLDEGMFLLYMLVLFLWTTLVYAAKSSWYMILIISLIQLLILATIFTLIIGTLYLIKPDTVNISS